MPENFLERPNLAVDASNSEGEDQPEVRRTGGETTPTKFMAVRESLSLFNI